MKKYFDTTFWKMVTGLLVVIFLVLILDLALNYYNERMYGDSEIEEMQRMNDQRAQQ